MEHSIPHIKTEILQLINAQQAWAYKIIPFKKEGNILYLYTDNINIQNELEIVLGIPLQLEYLAKEKISTLLVKFYRKKENGKKIHQASKQNIVHHIIEEAKRNESSDIHIEVLEDKARVRFRIDGKLQEKLILDKAIYPELINKIKIQSKLQIAEKRLPQDGRMLFKSEMYNIDIRVSILPTLYGEKIVLRLLGTNAKNIYLSDLGMNIEEKELYLKGVNRASGIVLISGPTGSGKTTTLYATLNYLNDITKNIITIEDPIEYTLEGINQVQLKEQIGLSFPQALRSFLRQDPDVIMVGEIRDTATAQMAIRASLTGHLVLSTIHTNSAIGTISRLIDMGVPSFLIADTLNLSVAQRLVRLLCTECKKAEAVTLAEIPPKYQEKIPSKAFVAKGCPHCFYTGYKGRIAVFETIKIDEKMKRAIKENQLEEFFIEQKHLSLADKCFSLYKKGKTSLQEIYAILLGN